MTKQHPSTPSPGGSDTVRLTPVVLAGGTGTRLWPMSREDYPKQLLRLTGTNTLLQETVTRLAGLEERDRGIDVTAPLLVCNEEHRFLVTEQLESIGMEVGAGRIILEPVGRNTAPALTLAALRLRVGGDDPLLLVMPSDHVIADRDGFQRAVVAATELAMGRCIVTFAIKPSRPETGYGYIRLGDPLRLSDDGLNASSISAFVEKPCEEIARQYVESREYFWNAGLFMMRASVWLDAIEACRPDILHACRLAHDAGAADGTFYRVDAQAFAEVPGESIDYAVMEPIVADSPGPGKDISGALVGLDARWSDVGSWQALLELGAGTDVSNLVEGDVYQSGSQDCLVLSSSRLVVALGLKDTIVVETPDAVLVADKAQSQEVKGAVSWLKSQERTEGKLHRRSYRPWGDYEQLDMGERYQVKRLTVKPGATLSLQMHHHRAEHWVVVRGTAKVTRGDEEFLLTENESTYIPIGTRHRLANPGTVPLEVIEVQSGSYLGEDDIVRFEDVYNRVV